MAVSSGVRARDRRALIVKAGVGRSLVWRSGHCVGEITKGRWRVIAMSAVESPEACMPLIRVNASRPKIEIVRRAGLDGHTHVEPCRLAAAAGDAEFGELDKSGNGMKNSRYQADSYVFRAHETALEGTCAEGNTTASKSLLHWQTPFSP